MYATDRGAGPAVVLVHGQPGEGRGWDRVARVLEADHRVIVPDRPGYGRTGGDAVGISANADAVVGLLDQLELADAVVVGHSWGGAVALDLAERHPRRVAALVLVASVGTAGSIDLLDRLLAFPVVGPLLSAAALAPLQAKLFRHFLELHVASGPAEIADVSDGLVTPWLRAWRSFVSEQRSLLTELPEITAALDQVAAPTVVIIGGGDRVVRPASQEELAQSLSRSQVEVVRLPTVGHLIPLQAPEAVVDAVAVAAARRSGAD